MNTKTTNEENTLVGFRLEYMELLNWGTFHNKIWRIEPNGNNSLLTGSIGSGKSTVVDALTTLLVPQNKITFNKAANPDTKERNLLSYIRGEYKRERDESDTKGKAITLRYNAETGSTFSIVLGNFANPGYETDITLCSVFWLKDNQPQKLLIISKKPLNIREHFTKFEDIAELKKRLRQLDYVELFDDNFTKYSQSFRHLFGMNSEKAIDLFNQTVSMKSVKSLTEFVREQMLEKTDIKIQIEELKRRFDDLNKAYFAVQDARKQRDFLKPLVELSDRYKDHDVRLKEIENIASSIPSYFATKRIALLEEEMRNSERMLTQLTNQLGTIKKSLTEKRKTENQVRREMDDKGGKRLIEMDAEIEQTEKEREIKKNRFSHFANLISTCELPTVASEEAFYSNVEIRDKKLTEISSKYEAKLSEKASMAVQARQISDDIRKEEEEIDSLQKRRNQIPLEILGLRAQIAEELQLKIEDIPFVGELLKVDENEKEWEGSIERLLRGFGLSMLVPENLYKEISDYVNHTRLSDGRNKGMRLDYFKVPHNFKTSPVTIDENSVINKIEIKPGTPFEDWLQNELNRRFNLHCVPMSEFQRQRDVITKEGQFKTGEFRHTKDDRRDLLDRRNFILGWSSSDKIRAVESDLSKLNENRKAWDSKLGILGNEISLLNEKISALKLLQNFSNWDELNWQDEAEKAERLQKEKLLLASGSVNLQALQTQLQVVTREINSLEDTEKEKTEELGGHKSKIDNCTRERESSKAEMITLFAEEARPHFYKLDDLTKDVVKLSLSNISHVENTLRNRYIGKNGEQEKVMEASKKVRDKIIRTMTEFKKEFPAESADLNSEVDSRFEYLKIYDSIVKEGLPSHEERLKSMLRETTVHDIVAFDNKLDSHEKAIRKKIEDINQHLREIEYNKGTYIKLLADRIQDKEVRDFKQELKDCYSNISGPEDAYTEERFNRVKKILDRFSSNENDMIEWSAKVTDVRNWFAFNAAERYLLTEEEKEFYAGTSGKSGGQKEKLAYTILASALAYQFGLQYGEPKSKSFRFVVIDEAFGRGDDESTQFGLGLFKKLNLQLLIVTPLQKIHVIESYINAVHYISNPEGNQSEIQNLTVEEYKEEKHLRSELKKGKSDSQQEEVSEIPAEE